MSYYNLINTTDNIKTIVLNTPEQCLSANTIRKKLVEDGHQLLPEALFPNEIHISYLEKKDKNNTINNTINIIETKSGSNWYMLNN
jgi:hypothetical protein